MIFDNLSGADAVDRETPIDNYVRLDRMTDRNPTHPDITFFLPDLRGGGAQQVFCNLSAGFAERGYTADLLVTWATGELRRGIHPDVRVVELAPPHIPAIGSAAGIPAMIEYIDSATPPVLYSAMTYANVSAIVAARLARNETAVVPTEHTMLRHHQTSIKDRFVNRTAGYLYPGVDAIIAVSESVADEVSEVIGLDRESISVVHNPIVTPDLEEKAASPVEDWIPVDATDVLVSVGRLAEEKDFATLLRALAHLVSDHNRDAALVIFGDGPQRGRLQQLAKTLEISERVSIPGYVDNPYKYLQRASVFVSSSRFEGLPTTIVEAMACGCPVVATDCPGGSAEVLCDGRYGTLVPVGDPQALASSIDTTLRSPPDSERLRERADDFTTDSVIKKHLQFIRQYLTPENVDSRGYPQ